MTDQLCECGSNLPAEACCLPYLNSLRAPQTAEALMRSRYTAFVMRDETYLLNTWLDSERPSHLEFDDRRWIGLKINSTRIGTEHDDEGWVNFTARYKVNGRAYRLEEQSHFVRKDGQWFYDKAEG